MGKKLDKRNVSDHDVMVFFGEVVDELFAVLGDWQEEELVDVSVWFATSLDNREWALCAGEKPDAEWHSMSGMRTMRGGLDLTRIDVEKVAHWLTVDWCRSVGVRVVGYERCLESLVDEGDEFGEVDSEVGLVTGMGV